MTLGSPFMGIPSLLWGSCTRPAVGAGKGAGTGSVILLRFTRSHPPPQQNPVVSDLFFLIGLELVTSIPRWHENASQPSVCMRNEGLKKASRDAPDIPDRASWTRQGQSLGAHYKRRMNPCCPYCPKLFWPSQTARSFQALRSALPVTRSAKSCSTPR